MADTDKLALLKYIFKSLHEQSEQLAHHSPPLEEGSALAEDRRRSVLGPADRAYLHLRTSHQFLLSIGHLLEVTGLVNPFGVEQALGRTALLASCKALYLLEPSTSNDRLSRCAALMLSDDRSSLRELSDTLNVLGTDDPMYKAWEEWKGDLEVSPARVNKELAALGLETAAYKGDGDLFRKAGRYLDAVDPLEPLDGLAPSKSMTSEALLVRYWNQTSGYAHANIWPHSRIATSKPGDTVDTVTASVDDLRGLLMITYRVFESAFALLKRKGKRHAKGAAFGLPG